MGRRGQTSRDGEEKPAKKEGYLSGQTYHGPLGFNPVGKPGGAGLEYTPGLGSQQPRAPAPAHQLRSVVACTLSTGALPPCCLRSATWMTESARDLGGCPRRRQPGVRRVGTELPSPRPPRRSPRRLGVARVCHPDRRCGVTRMWVAGEASPRDGRRNATGKISAGEEAEGLKMGALGRRSLEPVPRDCPDGSHQERKETTQTDRAPACGSTKSVGIRQQLRVRQDEGCETVRLGMCVRVHTRVPEHVRHVYVCPGVSHLSPGLRTLLSRFVSKTATCL